MSALVTLIDGAAVTTSLAIAEGTQTQHKNVMELLRTYQDDFRPFGRVAFQTRPFETPGGIQHREVALLNEQHATLLLTYMRNSDVVRFFKQRLVMAFWELQRSGIDEAYRALNNPAAMRGLLLTYAEKVLALEDRVAEQAPKVQVFDRIAAADGSLCLRDAAKALQIRPKELTAWLREHRWIYSRPGHSGWLAYQNCIQAGTLMHKVHVLDSPDTGVARVSEQVRVTIKGLTTLAHRLSSAAA